MEIHRCRFVDYTPAAINALAFAPATCRKPIVACARASGQIELWNPLHDWHLERTIPGSTNASIEALAWTHQTEPTDTDMDDDESDSEETVKTERKRLLNLPPRLFSVGLHAIITEWDLNTLRPRKTVDSHGGAIWCVAASNDQTKLAVGCEDGCVRLFDVSDGGLEYIKSFDKQKGRILSIAWDPTDKYIITGSSESSLSKWDVTSGRTISRMTVETAARGELTLVWAVTVLADGTIVSGDSLGHVTFWDSKSGVVRQSIIAHSADVLCLAANRSGTTLFSSGVDRKVNQYRLVSNDSIGASNPTPTKAKPKNKKIASESGQMDTTGTKWVLAGNRRYHSHDVRALALDETRPVNAIISGGVDVQINICPAEEFPLLNQRRLPFFPHKPIVSLVKERRWIVARYPDKIRVWALGRAQGRSEEREYHLALAERQKSLMEIQMQGNRHLTTSAMSSDGQWLAVSDIEEIKLFRIEENSKGFAIRKVKSFPTSFSLPATQGGGAHYLTFTPDCAKLVIATVDSQIVIVDLELYASDEFRILRRFGHHRGSVDADKDGDGKISPIVSLVVSADGQWLASGDLLNRVNVFNLDALQFHCTTPKFSAQHTMLCFHPVAPTLVIPLTSNEFYVYDVEASRLSDWSRENSTRLPSRFLILKDKITGVAFNPTKPAEVTLWGATYMCFVRLDQEVGPINATLNIPKRKREDHFKALAKAKKIEEREMAIQELVKAKPEWANTEWSRNDGKHRHEGPNNFQLLHKYQPLMLLDYVDENSMVVVERPWFDILAKLPPSFYKARYGT